MAEEGKRIIGIDLGTTFSAMAYLDRHGDPVTIANNEGDLTTPSVVLIEEDGHVVVGREARRSCIIYPDRVAMWVKRDMGERHYRHLVAGKQYTPQALAAFILKKLRQDAEKRLGEVAGAVITVPAHFDETRRQATVEAGELAGLDVLDIINEPTSAALAYAFRHFVDRGGKPEDVAAMAVSTTAPTTAMVYDLGGGTFDVTIIRIAGDDLRVLATDGDVQLGGNDWDERVVKYAADRFVKHYGGDPREDPQSLQELLLVAEDAKKSLSQREQTQMYISHKGERLAVGLTREQFEEMTADLLYRTESRVDRVIRSIGLGWDAIDEILLTGGSTRMPQVVNMLRRVSKKEPNGTLSVDEVVAHGAAIHGAIIQVGGVRPHARVEELMFADEDEEEEGAVGAEAIPETPAVPHRPMPREAMAEPAAAAPAMGEADFLAAGAGSIFDDGGDLFDQDIEQLLHTVKSVNVNAHSLGVVVRSHTTGREYNSILIPRNSPLPASERKIYGTVKQNQKYVRVEVLEGESEDPDACIHIGEAIVSPLPYGLPKGSPVSVAFTYDSSGRLHVRARDETSGQLAETTIVRPTLLSKAEMQKGRQAVSDTSVT